MLVKNSSIAHPERIGGAIALTLRSCKNLFVALGLSAMVLSSALAEDRYIPSTPEPGSDIPQSTIRLGMKPYADNSFYVIAMDKGWFQDVGISIAPKGGISLNEDNTNAMVMNGNVDITAQFPPMSLPTYRTSKAIKQIMFTDVIVSASILAHPSLGLKTFRDFIKEGKNFDEAIRAALNQTVGKQLVAPAPVVERVFEDAVSKFSDVNFDLKIMEDSQILVAARSGQIKFAHPGGAPIVYSLIQAGWVPIVSLADLLEYAPKDSDSPLIPSIFIVGNVANADFINNNQTTILRFLSVVWRTIDELARNEALFEIQAPYLNSVAGTSLTGPEIAATVRNFHPFTAFDKNGQYYADDNLLNYRPIYEALIREYQNNGILPAGSVEPDDFIWGGALWNEMRSYREKTDALFAKLDSSSLSDTQRSLIETARKHYGWHNYLDAYRLALAASKG